MPTILSTPSAIGVMHLGYSLQTFYLALSLCFCLIGLIALLRRSSKALSVPPGPPADFFLGHLRILPTSFMWLTYERWSKTYGDVMYLRVMGQGILVLSSLDAARELLEKQVRVTSDRPRFTMIAELMGWDWAIQFQSMGARLRRYRRAVQACLHPRAMADYHKIIEDGSVEVLASLVDNPPNKLEAVKISNAGLIMSILYGEKRGRMRDQYVHNADAAVDGLVEAGNVGKFLVDLFPLLKFVPEWFPGAHFQKLASRWKEQARLMIEIPYNNINQQYLQGEAPACVVKTLLEQQQDQPDAEMVMAVAGVLFVGGADTALSTAFSFIYAMVMNPEVQQRAHEEIYAHIGDTRLPTLADRPSLKYFENVFLETYRWSPAVPLGVPHHTSEDCQLGAYRIPKGTTVLVNQWAILRDERIYADPLLFKPERYAPKEGIPDPDPRAASFGYGRRSCPGKQFADSYLWTLMVRLLATYKFEKARDVNGVVIEPSGQYISSMVTRPADFPFSVSPRSKALEAVVRSAL